MKRINAALVALGTAAFITGCSEDTGSEPKKNPSGGSLPYTPQGCSYQVSAPDGIEEASLSSDDVGSAPAPKHIHVSWAGAPESTFALNWATDLDTKVSKLLYGTDQATVQAADGPGSGVTEQDGHTMLIGSTLFQDQKERVHEVHVCGLTADTTYYYKVGGPGNWSDTYDTATAPAPGATSEFKFLVTGDARSGPEVFAQIQEKASTEGIDFEIFSGDFIDNTTNQTMWEQFFEGTSGTFATQDLIARRQLMAVNGNHDNLSAYYIGQFAFPQDVSSGETAQGEEWYTFDYANTHFVMLNSEANNLADQTQFMQADLAKVDRQKTPWVVVVFHTPPYTCGSTHQSDSAKPRDAWASIFDQYHVDLVLTGHVHNYQRTKALNAGVAVTGGANDTPQNGNGTLYVVSAGAGGDLYNADPASTCPFSHVTEKVNNYVIIDIADHTLHYNAYRIDGSVLDSFDYTK